MKKNLILNYIGNAWYTIMGIVFIPLYIKYLGTESYGLIGIFAVIQGWLALLDMGMASTVSREMAIFKGGAHTTQSIRNLFRSINVIYMIIALCMILGIILLSPVLVKNWLKIENLPQNIVIHALYITGFVIAFRWMGGLYQSAFAGLQEFFWLNAIKVVFSTLRGIGVIAVLIWLSPTITAYFVYQGIIAGLETLTSAIILNKLMPKADLPSQFSWESIRNIWRFAAGITAITLVSMALTQIDKLLLSKWLSLTYFGYYTLASVLAGGLYMIVGPINSIAGPDLTKLVAKGNQTNLHTAYHKYVQIISITVVPAALVISIFANHLFFLWIKDPIITKAVSPIASILIIGNMLNALMFIPYQLQIAHRWTRFATIQNSIAIVVLLPVIYFATKYYGAVGAASTYVLLNLGYLTIALPLMHRRLLKGELNNFYWKDVAPGLFSTLVTLMLLKAILPNPVMGEPFKSFFVLAIASFTALISATISLKIGRDFIANSKLSILNLIKKW